MFGVTPMPIYDPEQKTAYLKDFMVFFKPGDMVKWNPISREEYDNNLKQVEAGTYQPRISQVEFSLDEFNKDIDGTNAQLLEVLNAN